MMLDWNDYHRQILATLAQLGRLSPEEIAEALGVAVAVNAGAALIYSTRVLDAAASAEDGAKAPS